MNYDLVLKDESNPKLGWVLKARESKETVDGEILKDYAGRLIPGIHGVYLVHENKISYFPPNYSRNELRELVGKLFRLEVDARSYLLEGKEFQLTDKSVLGYRQIIRFNSNTKSATSINTYIMHINTDETDNILYFSTITQLKVWLTKNSNLLSIKEVLDEVGKLNLTSFQKEVLYTKLKLSLTSRLKLEYKEVFKN